VSWQAASFMLLALGLAAGFAWYEREKPPSRVLALVAALAALAVVGRLAFAAIPNVKPTTDIVLFAGYALGALPGFAVGAVTAIVSNIFLSQGPWTVWQMAGWGAVGVGGALLARTLRGREPGRLALAAVCGLAGLAFGAWMDVYQWTLAGRQDLDTYLVIAASSLPYNLAHAIGNVIFCLLIGPVFLRSLARYRRRLEVRWPAPAGAAAALVPAVAVAVAALALAAAPVGAASRAGAASLIGAASSVGAASPASAASTLARAERYLLRAQNRDGGFGAVPGQRSSPLYTGWAGLGLAASGRNPRDVARPGGRSITASLRGGSSLADIGEIERTVLLLEAAGLDPRRFGRRNLVAQIARRRRPDGSIAGFVSYTAFGVLALRAAGESAGRRTVAWLLSNQNPDGGFGVATSSGSDSDMTGAVLQTLAVTGRARSRVAERAVDWLLANQSDDGGFGQMRGRTSNAQSTAYAVQGLVAVRSGADAVRGALAYLRRLARPDGSIAYSRTSSQTPVWVTAQALMALRRKPLPLATVPREPRRRARAAGDARGAGDAGTAPAASVATGSGGRGTKGGPSGEDGSATGTSAPGEARSGEEAAAGTEPGAGSGPAAAAVPGLVGEGSQAAARTATPTGTAPRDQENGPSALDLALGLAVAAAASALAWRGARRRRSPRRTAPG
jgi:energy-coupling factor transport system substrate-specific component